MSTILVLGQMDCRYNTVYSSRFTSVATFCFACTRQQVGAGGRSAGGLAGFAGFVHQHAAATALLPRAAHSSSAPHPSHSQARLQVVHANQQRHRLGCTGGPL